MTSRGSTMTRSRHVEPRADEAPAEEKRRGLFRRRKPVSVEATAEVVAEDEVSRPISSRTSSRRPSTEFVGNGHAWSYVPETSNELHLEATDRIS